MYVNTHRHTHTHTHTHTHMQVHTSPSLSLFLCLPLFHLSVYILRTMSLYCHRFSPTTQCSFYPFPVFETLCFLTETPVSHCPQHIYRLIQFEHARFQMANSIPLEEHFLTRTQHTAVPHFQRGIGSRTPCGYQAPWMLKFLLQKRAVSAQNLQNPPVYLKSSLH
jgi:hypothetical protein